MRCERCGKRIYDFVSLMVKYPSVDLRVTREVGHKDPEVALCDTCKGKLVKWLDVFEETK